MHTPEGRETLAGLVDEIAAMESQAVGEMAAALSSIG